MRVVVSAAAVDEFGNTRVFEPSAQNTALLRGKGRDIGECRSGKKGYTIKKVHKTSLEYTTSNHRSGVRSRSRHRGGNLGRSEC